MSAAAESPAVSVIVVSSNGADALARCLRSLDRQRPIPGGSEVLVVRTRNGDERGSQARTARDVIWVTAPRNCNVAQMRTLGIARSRGRIVALLEDDCVVAESWGDNLVRAHSGPEGAVGGPVEPGGLRSRLDWAMYFCEFSRFLRPGDGATAALPGTNVSYKRTALAWRDQPDTSPGTLDGFYESFIHVELRRRGWAMKLDGSLPATYTHTWSLSRALGMRFHHGRGYGGLRLAGEAFPRRLAFAVLALGLPLLQVARVIREVAAARRYARELLTAWPWVVGCATSWSLGEAIGYLRGPGSSLARWR